MPRDALETAARIGWTARGALYFILGALATLAAVGEGGGLHDNQGVVRWIMSLPAGTLLVGLAACGFAGYALYCGALAIFGQEDSPLVARLKGGIGFLVYSSLTFTSIQLLLGHHSGSDSKKTWIAMLLAEPWGRVLIGVAGICLIGFGLYQCKYAASGKHKQEVQAGAMSTRERSAFVWIGRVGLTARGLVFAVIGYFTVRAAFKAGPSAAAGTVEALREIRNIGWVPLAVIALGLAAYGVLQLFYAKYRKIELA
jgi:hypothetical protein